MPLVPSLLDRLIEPRGDEPPLRPMQGQTLSELEEAVRRDVQELLNTRQSVLEPYPEDSELARSLLSYGLPDLGHLNPNSPDQRQLLQRFVEQAIAHFEPRLEQVRVTALAPDQDGRGLRMTIQALLRVAPAPVPVSFDTLVQPGSSKWQVVPPGAG
jgi:type VI secretion system protein ImpF